MFSMDSARQAEACRFCWMCRHICPVANSTGNEAWTPRARGLMVSMVERGLEYTGEIAETMYHCTLCDACANDCATGYKPSDFIREARTQAVVADVAPKAVMDTIERIIETKRIFPEPCADDVIRNVLGALPKKADVLLFAGQTATTVCPEIAIHAARLMQNAGIEFAMLTEEPECGAFLSELMGNTGEVQSAASGVAGRISAAGAKTVVVLNPADAVFMKDEYRQWGLLRDINVVTATEFFSGMMKQSGAPVPEKTLTASLQEPVKLTRGLDETEPLKNLISRSQIELREFFLNGKMSRCIGTIPLYFYAPHVVREMVRVRCEDALRIGSRKIITASPDDYWIMSRFAYGGVEIHDLFSVLDKG